METIDEDFQISNTDTASRLLNDLWNVFYSWEYNYCYNVLASLEASDQQPLPDVPAAVIGTPWEFCATFPSAELIDDVYWELEDADVDSTVRHPCQPISVQRHSTAGAGLNARVVPLEAYPSYTSCTPSSRNILVKDLRHVRAQFPQFPDNPNFNVIEYLRDFEDFAWQNNYDDPDCTCLCFKFSLIY
jgi:hypothetical protein